MRSFNYGKDILSTPRKKQVVPEVAAEVGVVAEDPDSGFCGAVVRVESGSVLLEDAAGRRRLFPMTPAAFLIDGRPVTLVRPAAAPPGGPRVSASGSVKVEGLRARTAAASRIWVEGIHDAELVERVWGHDLRVEGVVVEPLHGVDDLAALVAEFGPAPARRLGVLVDHLVEGSKESRVVAAVTDPNVLVTGHPYVDIWQAVKPSVLGIPEWPVIPKGTPWKEGVCARLGWGDPADGWRRVLSSVNGFRDLESPLLGAVERLIDFVTAPA
ncbi:DUF3097 domain-containing protein [Allokutzneria albata]|uniref:DUF3097 domain-containing protein n=1 Tax=Allokutzneria albata TaxID=211114 RepID=A0A1G9V5B7_ALLAB|nr:DUF3097 domain-containing protein [Allokutzneria albata]SDM67329.1 Protein of unknown function [Allokutzneria albata]